MIECEKLGTLHFSVAYLGVVYLNQSSFFFLAPAPNKRKVEEIPVLYLTLPSECSSTFKDFFITLGMYTCTP